MTVDTRTELRQALSEAAELEHGLLCQYLFAAFSLKKFPFDQDLTLPQREMVREWEGLLLWVALEEMAHLGTVCNIQSAIGMPPHFDRPSFPQDSRYFPTGAPKGSGEQELERFSLEPMNEETLRKFIRFESPEPVKSQNFALQPDELHYQTIGELYEQIRQGILSIPESELFIGPAMAQDTDDWNTFDSFLLHNVSDRASAERAIKFIVEDGEGTAERRKGSHYDSFMTIQEQWAAAKQEDPDFVPHRPVISNPLLPVEKPNPQHTERYVTNPDAAPLLDLFNDLYTTALMLLNQYFSVADQRRRIRAQNQPIIRHIMSGFLRPLGDLLTQLPAQQGGENAAGPGFQIHTSPLLSHDQPTARLVIQERLDHAAALSARIRVDGATHPRIKTLEESLHVLTDSFRRQPE